MRDESYHGRGVSIGVGWSAAVLVSEGQRVVVGVVGSGRELLEICGRKQAASKIVVGGRKS